MLAAAAVVPIHAFARDRLGRVGAAFVAVSYATFWGVHQAVTSDFHEVAFAPLLIACAIRRLQGALARLLRRASA